MGLSHSEVALDRPIRNPRRTWSFALFAWLFGGAMLSFGILLTSMARQGIAEEMAGVAMCWAIGALAVWYGARLRRAELRIGVTEVTVRNPVRCIVSAPQQIERFEAGNVTPHANNPTPGIVMRLSSGKLVPIWALAEEATIFSSAKRTATFTPLAEELNSLLALTRAGASAGRSPA